VLELAERASTLTRERLEELAELPEPQRRALAYGPKAPLVYVNVALRRWHPFVRRGVHEIWAPGCFYSLVRLDFPVSLPGYRCARTPDELLDETPRAKEPPARVDDLLFSGLFPRIHDAKLDPTTWLDGYVRTYVERDVRTVAGVGDLDSFARFLGLCAGRAGGIVNSSALGSDAGVSHVTVKRWLSILRASYVIDLLQPHHENFTRRLVKSPKLYFVDTGLLCHLLGIRRSDDLARHPLRGAIFENLVVSEFRKLFLHHGERPPVFFWRDSHGHEIDLLVDLGTRRVPVEAKAGITVASDSLAGLDWYVGVSDDPGGILVYGGTAAYRRKSHLVRPWFDCS